MLLLIRKLRFGKKNIRARPKIIKFDAREPNQRTRSGENFKKLCDNLQNCLPSSSFFLFHDLKSDSDEQSNTASEKGEGDQEDTPFTDNYDIATAHFKKLVDEHVENLTITDKEISDTERLTRGQTNSGLTNVSQC